MDEHLLVSLGLSENEVAAYKALLEMRELSPAVLAKRIGIKRTTAYAIVRGLVERGLVIEDVSRRPRVFKLAGAADIQVVLETEKKRFEDRQALLERLSEGVAAGELDPRYPVPSIRFIEEAKIDQYFRKAFPTWIKSMQAEERHEFWGFQDATLVDKFEDQLHYWWKVSPPSMHVYLLTNLASGEKKVRGQYPQRHLKYWGEATDFITSTWIAGDYVVMINTRSRPFYVIEIHSRPLAHDQREVFKNLWELI